ncbi:MAG: crossover junction endodeoxyribonuclease RuvC, partial [Pseudomonadota bacterium]
MIILGIDPGSRITGFGLINNQTDRIEYIHSGSVKVIGEGLPDRLGHIYSEIEAIIAQYHPEQMSIENVFMSRNADSALKLGQARGAAICAGHQAGLKIAEYAAREVKQSIVGSGEASKDQVQNMVKRLLGLKQPLQADEADGLAIAICHAQFYATQQKTGLDAG